MSTVSLYRCPGLGRVNEGLVRCPDGLTRPGQGCMQPCAREIRPTLGASNRPAPPAAVQCTTLYSGLSHAHPGCGRVNEGLVRCPDGLTRPGQGCMQPCAREIRPTLGASNRPAPPAAVQCTTLYSGLSHAHPGCGRVNEGLVCCTDGLKRPGHGCT